MKADDKIPQQRVRVAVLGNVNVGKSGEPTSIAIASRPENRSNLPIAGCCVDAALIARINLFVLCVCFSSFDRSHPNDDNSIDRAVSNQAIHRRISVENRFIISASNIVR